ncbi:S-layer family protein [Geminocystis sp. NIES-3709]|uniref:beta strand repeat-containing protein n=1 Tax=Geminocystis sp. NIES-3709 TaxID=1617448 RepID=UPI0005FCB1C5|nr:Calx-beta domain-containing protein [Geminocystis sp. NIES-3709]BAQ63402.1 alkaline phosphatase [Geminocystis sp. NIES-3709]
MSTNEIASDGILTMGLDDNFPLLLKENLENNFSEFDFKNYILKLSQDDQEKLEKIKGWEIPHYKLNNKTIPLNIYIVQDGLFHNNSFYSQQDHNIYLAKSFLKNTTLNEIKSILVKSINNLPIFSSIPENASSISLSDNLESIISNVNPHTLICQCGSCSLPYGQSSNQNQATTIIINAPTTLGNTFKLHSNPNANHTIYLDFDGHFMSSSLWEDGGSLRLGSYDTDGNPNSFSNAELEEIQLMWQRAAEDFAPFNINVTTEEPTDLGDLINSGGGDTRWGIRVVMTDNLNLDTGSEITNAGGGGTAYLESFNWNYDEVALTFNQGAYEGGETISHEVGHTLGLNHDGQLPGREYYEGHGSGETSWAPIMGAGFTDGDYDNVTQWSKASEYYNGNQTEDDLAIITTNNGFGYRTDDHGNTNVTATVLDLNNLNNFGIIERNTDIDIFSFNTIGNSTFYFNINPISRALISDGAGGFSTEYLESYGANLDIWARIYDNGGNLIAQSNPANTLSANFSNLFLSAGQYYLHIDGVGIGNPLSSNPTGYTDYGSLGQYYVSGTFNPNYIALAINATNANQFEGNSGTTSFTFTVTRSGITTNTDSVNWAITGSGANPSNGGDFVGGILPSGTVSFAPGETSKVITVNVQGDTAIEPNETFTVTLSNPTNGATFISSTAIGTIQNDDGIVTLSNTTPILIDDVNVGGSTPYPSDINVSGLGGNISKISVTLNNLSHSWTGDIDILLVGPTGAKTILMSDIGENIATNGVTLTFDATAANFLNNSNITTSGNYKPNNLVGTSGVEPDFFPSPAPADSYNMDLSVFNNTNPNGIWSLYVVDDDELENVGTIAGGWSLNIETDIPTTPRINLIGNQTVVEGITNPQNVTYTVTLSQASTQTVTVQYATIDGTAIAGQDYTSSSGTLTFSPGQTSQTITIPILNDSINEPNETFTLILSDPNNGTLDNTTAITTIIDTLSTSVTTTLPANVENLTLTGTANINGTGNTGDNILLGNSGNNILNGGAGNDRMIGSSGNDIYYVDNIGDIVEETASQGIFDQVFASISYTLTENVESLTLIGTGNINGTGNNSINIITGNTGNNTLIGNGGIDSLDGGAGNDTMIGGSGNDTYYVDSLGDVVVEEVNQGIDRVFVSISYTLGDNLENLFLDGTENINGTGNSLDNNITGNSGNDTLNGGDGDDTLDGGGGNDRMVGGNGNDTYYIDSTADIVVENLNGGTDLVRVTASINYTLTSNVENLIFSSGGTFNGTGNSLNNIITRFAGPGSLSGLDGNDTLNGAASGDSLFGGNGDDILDGGEGNDTLLGDADNDTLNGGDGNDSMAGGNGNDILNGNAGNDSLTGGNGNDILNGNNGNDSMVGGSGNDTYYVDSDGDVVVENFNEGTDLVIASITYTLGANVENLTLSGTGNINGTGNGLNNIINGNNGNNFLFGGSGNDSLTGGNSDDGLSGDLGNDTLNGGTGNDIMMGGFDNDTYYVDSVGDILTENLNEGIDVVIASISYALGSNLENLILDGTANINGTGNSSNNNITGNSGNNSLNGGDGNDSLTGGSGNDNLLGSNGNDTLNGGAENDTLNGSVGNDSMVGGSGNDIYIVDALDYIVSETSTTVTEIDTVQSSITYTLGANLEHLILTGTSAINGTGNNLPNNMTGNSGNNILNGVAGNDSLTGDAGNDTLFGSSGNDTLDGGTGNDSMVGGSGNDIYIVDAVGDIVSETSTTVTEIDTVQSSITYTLGANLEHLILTGTSAINGTGNNLPNNMTGNSGNNILDGVEGNDSLTGGNGDDSLWGGADNDTLDGGEGNDTLNGGTGNDNMVGGTGNDVYIVDAMGDIVTETSTTVTEIEAVKSSITYTLGANLEHLILTDTSATNGTGNNLPNNMTGNSGNNILDGVEGNDSLTGGNGDDNLWGGADNDTLDGGEGNDTLNGGTGNDNMVGGTGNDVYIVDAMGDIVTETSTTVTEIEAVQSSITYTLGANLEHLILTGTSAINGTGNNLPNNMTGNSGNNILDGVEGNDSLTGGNGDDNLWGDADNDTLDGGEGNDTLNGGTGNDTIRGDSTFDNLTGDDTIDGGSGNDSILGGGANDFIYGGDGDDMILGQRGDDTLSGDNGNDFIDASNDNDFIYGGDGADTINGGSGNDFIDGATENDSILGGLGDDTVNGGNGDDIIIGGAGHDSLYGENGDDTINGLGENDTIDGGDGNDWILGGAGNDFIDGGVGEDTISASNDNDTILGGDGNDSIDGGSGNDSIDGGNGNDILLGYTGHDTLDGGTGNDSLVGSSGNDLYIVDAVDDIVTETSTTATEIDTIQSSIICTLGANLENLILTGTSAINGTGNTLDNNITGNSGNNILNGGDGDDTLNGGNGDDNLLGENGNNNLVGGEGNDTIDGGSGNDSILGGDANDTIDGGYGDDTILGQLGNDTLLGDNGNDFIDASNDNDFIYGGDGADTINGGSGNDFIDGATENDSMLGGLGDDTLFARDGDDIIIGGAGNDSLYGENGDDTINGFGENDTIDGGDGNDWILGGAGNDFIDGGVGEDTISASNDNDTILGGDGNDSIDGGSGNDSIDGGNGNDILLGYTDHDTLDGGNDNDTIIGSYGNDTLTGGTGNDFFRFDSPLEGIDQIADFNITDDTIQVCASGFGGGLGIGVLPSERFRVGSSPSTSDHRFFYNSSNGGLFFDVDGSDATSAVQIATLNTGLAMTNTDIVII